MSQNTTMLVLTSASANSNKFYEVTVNGDVVNVRYGRVGQNGQRTSYSGGEAKADALIRAKKRKGYSEVDVVTAPKAAATHDLTKAAMEGLGGNSSDSRVADLINLLVAQNKHQIIEASGGSITVTDGQVTTPLGLVTHTSITKARSILASMRSDFPPADASMIEQYLRLIPQNVGVHRGWQDDMFTSDADFVAQSQFLDQLEASVDFSLASARSTDNADNAVDGASLFRYRLTPVDDQTIIDNMQREYASSSSSMHGSGVNKAKVRAVYELTDTKGTTAFDALADKYGNVQQYWHGTRAFNVLSLAAKGFMMPRPGSFNYTASMFGNGIYFSEQSTKSANYARGGVWSSGSDSRWFMLRCDVVMGKEFSPCRANLRAGGYASSQRFNEVLSGQTEYQSINVKPGRCGVRSHTPSNARSTCGVFNHEAIVGNLDQIMPRYLVEFR